MERTEPYWKVSPDEVRSEANVAASVDSTAQGFVLLKNERKTLPFTASKSVAVIGPHAGSRQGLLGNYIGQICPGLDSKGAEGFGCVQSITEAVCNATAKGGKACTTSPGAPSVGEQTPDTGMIASAVKVASEADQIVLVLGIGSSIEAESKDRKNTSLPGAQIALWKAIAAEANKTSAELVVVLINGGVLDIEEMVAEDAIGSIVEAWYPGFFGAGALASTVFGEENRFGKLPVTIYDKGFDMDVLDFCMSCGLGRTYKYYQGTPVFPMGFGLSCEWLFGVRSVVSIEWPLAASLVASLPRSFSLFPSLSLSLPPSLLPSFPPSLPLSHLLSFPPCSPHSSTPPAYQTPRSPSRPRQSNLPPQTPASRSP